MLINFNLEQTQAYNGATPTLPPGEYVVEIVSEQADQPLQNGNGTALVFEYQIREGSFRGQRIRDWLNLGHNDPRARDVAQRRVKAIGEAVGVPVFRDTREIFNRPFLIAVSCRDWQGRQRNNIDDYRPIAQPSAPQSAPAQPPANDQPVRYW